AAFELPYLTHPEITTTRSQPDDQHKPSSNATRLSLIAQAAQIAWP
ncbi:unnamed protein product, partial [marine sediment metagenome]